MIDDKLRKEFKEVLKSCGKELKEEKKLINKKEGKMRRNIDLMGIIYRILYDDDYVKGLKKVVGKELKKIDDEVHRLYGVVKYEECDVLEDNSEYETLGRCFEERGEVRIQILRCLSEEEKKEVYKHELGHWVINKLFNDKIEREYYHLMWDLRDYKSLKIFLKVYRECRDK
jgi:hypothetical protein